MNKIPIQSLLVLTAVCGFVFLLSACADAPRTKNQYPHHERERAQIEQRLNEILAAAQSKDFDRLDSYHLYGPRFTKFSGISAERLDAAASRAGEHHGLSKAKDLKMRADDLKIDVFDRAAIATFILAYSYEAETQTLHKRDRATLVFIKTGRGWKIAHEHLSPVQP